MNGLIMNLTVPSWSSLLDVYNLTNIKEASAMTDLQRLEVPLLNLLVYFSFQFGFKPLFFVREMTGYF